VVKPTDRGERLRGDQQGGREIVPVEPDLRDVPRDLAPEA
jgi:hypothetical protein